MATPGTPVTVTVTYSNEKHSIQVASQQEESEPTLRDMALLIEQVTGVPIPFQKIIYKGKSLKEMEQPLSALGVRSGCKLMLIGKRNSPEEEAELKKLKDLEKSVEQIANKLEEINKEFIGIQKGFLAKDLQAEALKQLEKRIKGTAEQFMKILEQIDAIEVPAAWARLSPEMPHFLDTASRRTYCHTVSHDLEEEKKSFSIFSLPDTRGMSYLGACDVPENMVVLSYHFSVLQNIVSSQ